MPIISTNVEHGKVFICRSFFLRLDNKNNLFYSNRINNGKEIVEPTDYVSYHSPLFLTIQKDFVDSQLDESAVFEWDSLAIIDAICRCTTALNPTAFRGALVCCKDIKVMFAFYAENPTKIYLRKLDEDHYSALIDEHLCQAIARTKDDPKNLLPLLEKVAKQLFIEETPIMTTQTEIKASTFKPMYVSDTYVVTVSDVDQLLLYMCNGVRLEEKDLKRGHVDDLLREMLCSFPNPSTSYLMKKVIDLRLKLFGLK